jgi:hypothetical protein
MASNARQTLFWNSVPAKSSFTVNFRRLPAKYARRCAALPASQCGPASDRTPVRACGTPRFRPGCHAVQRRQGRSYSVAPDQLRCGVSIYFPRPWYQVGIPGMVNTAKGQTLIDSSGKKPQVIVKLPANFAGRNVPDLSVNSDADTGYTIFYTSDQNGFDATCFERQPEIGGPDRARRQSDCRPPITSWCAGPAVGILIRARPSIARPAAPSSPRRAPHESCRTPAVSAPPRGGHRDAEKPGGVCRIRPQRRTRKGPDLPPATVDCS